MEVLRSVTDIGLEIEDVLFGGLEDNYNSQILRMSLEVYLFRLRLVVGGVFRYTLLALTITRTRRWNYQNAQFLPDGSKIHRVDDIATLGGNILFVEGTVHFYSCPRDIVLHMGRRKQVKKIVEFINRRQCFS